MLLLTGGKELDGFGKMRPFFLGSSFSLLILIKSEDAENGRLDEDEEGLGSTSTGEIGSCWSIGTETKGERAADSEGGRAGGGLPAGTVSTGM